MPGKLWKIILNWSNEVSLSIELMGENCSPQFSHQKLFIYFYSSYLLKIPENFIFLSIVLDKKKACFMNNRVRDKAKGKKNLCESLNLSLNESIFFSFSHRHFSF